MEHKYFWLPATPIQRQEAKKNNPVSQSFEHIGKNPEEIPDDIVNRLERIELYSRFNEASRRIEVAYAKLLPEIAKLFKVSFSAEETQEARLGVLLHDVGKIGPPEADREAQKMIIELFAEDKFLKPTTLIRDAVVLRFGQAREEEVMKILLAHGLTEGSTMLDFWNAHSEWGNALLEIYKNELPELTRLVAASHHMGRNKGTGPNPFDLPVTLDRPVMETYVVMKKKYLLALLLIVLDKLEAIDGRGTGRHGSVEAILQNEGFDRNSYMQKIVTLVKEKSQDPNFFTIEYLKL